MKCRSPGQSHELSITEHPIHMLFPLVVTDFDFKPELDQNEPLISTVKRSTDDFGEETS